MMKSDEWWEMVHETFVALAVSESIPDAVWVVTHKYPWVDGATLDEWAQEVR
jgi:hypothetical protein